MILAFLFFCFFFFSSRRRHTRWTGDWSSDVCSSDLRLDGQYGTAAVLADLAGFAFVTRGKEYTVLDHPQLQARLQLRMIRSSRARKARSSAASTIVQTCQSAPRASRAAW